MGVKKPCTDHLGQQFPSHQALCEHHHVSMHTYHNRLRRGWTQEQALTTPTTGQQQKQRPKKDLVYDHEGNPFLSIPKMCRHWGITDKIFWSRKRVLHWPLEKILTTPVRDKFDSANAKAVTDHEQNKFPSISAMCRHWNVKLSTYRERRKRGWDIEQALTAPEKPINDPDPVACVDHEGRTWPSKNAMCRHYGVTRYCFESRIQRGWTLEQALTGDIRINAKNCEDHTGKPFPSAALMALYLGFPSYAFHRNDNAQKLIPELAAVYWTDRKFGRYRVKYCVQFPWFLVEHDQMDLVLHFDQILDQYHRSGSFRPIPEQKIKHPAVRMIKPIQWPWYLCLVNQTQYVLRYDQLLDAHVRSNFGLGAPDL